jgi:hypothetical protein
MIYKHLKYLCFLMFLSFLLLLSACGPTDNPRGNQGQNTTTPTTEAPQHPPTGESRTPVSSATPTKGLTTPIVITPSTNKGKPGTGPIIINSPTPVPGGPSGSQQAVLSDRTIIVNKVSKQAGTNSEMQILTLSITIKNTGSKAIENQATFFQLIGVSGDFFGQINSSDNFYGPIAAHSTRNGTIIFQLPTAAAARNLRLMYRSEVPAETVMLPIKA